MPGGVLNAGIPVMGIFPQWPIPGPPQASVKPGARVLEHGE